MYKSSGTNDIGGSTTASDPAPTTDIPVLDQFPNFVVLA
ncbi:hypothetical protein COLO4_18742 [Corchorus olitorius]|uniref:Uncharacterized protein n=1 Tax=Corchorus olitorius TaxID=93759 RepID=A0A1R3J855_9ROSI|nr:hypothetical protein COLO4_18742 [Corchorus olitorius]